MKLVPARNDRARRRRDFRLETLEDRNLLSAAAVASPAADVQHAPHVAAMHGAFTGVATLGTTTFDSQSDAVVPVTYTGSGTVTLSAGGVTEVLPATVTGGHTTVILASSGYTSSVVINGHATVVTPDGNIDLAYAGTGTLIPGTTHQFNDTFVYVVTGGTGEFAGAHGYGVIHSTDATPTSPTTVPFAFTIDGLLTKSGSNSNRD